MSSVMESDTSSKVAQDACAEPSIKDIKNEDSVNKDDTPADAEVTAELKPDVTGSKDEDSENKDDIPAVVEVTADSKPDVNDISQTQENNSVKADMEDDKMVRAEITGATGTACTMEDNIGGSKSEERASVSKETASENVRDESDLKEEVDEYTYTKRDTFTSEIYKISVTNLPKRFGFAEFKKKISNQLQLKPVKLKIYNDICYITFRCEEDREDALKKIEGYKWRGQPLKAALAKPAADPFMRKRKQEERGSGSSAEKKSRTEDDGLSPVERLKNSVTPLWKLSYEDQLKKKQEEMYGFFKKLNRQIDKNCPDLRSWKNEQNRKWGPIPCELQQIKPSPVTEGYRNKCEFTIGPGLEGEDSVVGFRYGLYSEGTVCVGSPEQVAFLPDTMKTVIRTFQQYLTSSGYTAFNPQHHDGHWRQLTLRTSRLGHVMAMVDFNPQALTQAAVEEEISKLKEHFMEGGGKDCGITSCYFRSHTERMSGAATDSPYKLVFGDEHITESLLGMKFRVSPNAFFQVNTVAAEVLYTQVSDWCNHSPTTTVLDVCCGTGTIGLTVAKHVERVIGVEMCSEAIKDAEYNAQVNGISNVKYHCAKAEDVMKMITRSVRSSDDVVAVVDPPRGGLHSSVVVALRNCRSINRLVYVSCNANGALNNFIDLIRPTSKRLKGPRFFPVKAVPVDLFPHTNHCELVILFERETSNTTAYDSD